MIKFIAVFIVQPFWMKISFIIFSEGRSVKEEAERYPIIIIGITISFAGSPKINASRITPSSPKRVANGSKKAEICASRLKSPILTFANSQIIIPAGTATVTARPSTNAVRSKSERTSIFKICGFLYGGISKVNAEGVPLKRVADNILVDINVKATESIMTKVKTKASSRLPKNPPSVTKNIEIIAIMAGKRPLQGTKLLVIIARILSRFESIILQPVTPAALQPKPIHIVSACFPQLLQRLKGSSRL